MSARKFTRDLFFAAAVSSALLAALPPKAAVHIPPDLRDSPSAAATQLSASGGNSGQAPEAPAATPVRLGYVSKVIIGDDDRIEYYEAPPALKAAADAVAAVAVKTVPEGAQNHQPAPLCPSERFHDQPALAFCTAFLIGEDLVATAGHCVDRESCANTRFVFDFAVKRPGAVPEDLGPKRRSYYCKEVIFSYFTPKSRDADMALVRLDRPVKGRKPLSLNLSRRLVEEGTPLLSIGHFLGVPLKISQNARVRLSTSVEEHSDSVWFTTDLDSFPGYSGGPVINSETGLVEGITARSGGHTREHFEVTPAGCRVAVTYPDGIEWGPEVNSIAPFVAAMEAQLLPATH